MTFRKAFSPGLLLPAVPFAAVLSTVAFLQLSSPALFGVDGYYHIRVPYFLRQFGPDYDFRWAQLSTFAEHFSDKELLFHVLTIPFTWLGGDIILQAKAAVIFFAFLFLVTFTAVLLRYGHPCLAAVAVAALPFTQYFFIYLNILRPKTLAVTLVIMLLWLVVEKKWLGVLAVSLLFPLAHISYPVVPLLCLAVEVVRRLHRGEFFFRNVVYALAGTAGGTFLHPNYPDNLRSLYLNGVVVPWSAVSGGISLSYGLEWKPVTTKLLFLSSPLFFLGLFLAMTLLVTGRVETRFPTAAFFLATCFFLFPALFSYCYWYYAAPVGLIFLALLFSDYLAKRPGRDKVLLLGAGGMLVALTAFTYTLRGGFAAEFSALQERNLHYQRAAAWMEENLPPGVRVFHASWSDSPYFIGLNPKDYYLVVLDPIYMYHWSAETYRRWVLLSQGRLADPAGELRERFVAKYGYTGSERGMYRQVLDMPDDFEVLYREPRGLIFRVR